MFYLFHDLFINSVFNCVTSTLKTVASYPKVQNETRVNKSILPVSLEKLKKKKSADFIFCVFCMSRGHFCWQLRINCLCKLYNLEVYTGTIREGVSIGIGRLPNLYQTFLFFDSTNSLLKILTEFGKWCRQVKTFCSLFLFNGLYTSRLLPPIKNHFLAQHTSQRMKIDDLKATL